MIEATERLLFLQDRGIAVDKILMGSTDGVLSPAGWRDVDMFFLPR